MGRKGFSPKCLIEISKGVPIAARLNRLPGFAIRKEVDTDRQKIAKKWRRCHNVTKKNYKCTQIVGRKAERLPRRMQKNKQMIKV